MAEPSTASVKDKSRVREMMIADKMDKTFYKNNSKQRFSILYHEQKNLVLFFLKKTSE